MALDSVTHERAVEHLSKGALGDPSVDVRAACTKALRRYRTTAVASVLTKAMDDSDYAVRRQAHESLVEMVGRDLGADPHHWHRITRQMPPPIKPAKPWWRTF